VLCQCRLAAACKFPSVLEPVQGTGLSEEAARGGVSETGGGATPLVDATARFLTEFLAEEESPSTQQQSQPAAVGTSRAGEEKKDDNVTDSFEPTYLYDVMKGKRQLKPLLVRSRAHVAASCYLLLMG
jgi:hypothetical protein